jgi:hypothetical protein
MAWVRVDEKINIPNGAELKLDPAAWGSNNWYRHNQFVTERNGEYFITVAEVVSLHNDMLVVLLDRKNKSNCGTLRIRNKAFINTNKKVELINELIKNLT